MNIKADSNPRSPYSIFKLLAFGFISNLQNWGYSISISKLILTSKPRQSGHTIHMERGLHKIGAFLFSSHSQLEAMQQPLLIGSFSPLHTGFQVDKSLSWLSLISDLTTVPDYDIIQLSYSLGSQYMGPLMHTVRHVL